MVDPRLFDVENLPAQGKNGLGAAVSPLLGGAPGGVSFDNKDFAFAGILLLTVGQFSREGAAFQKAFPSRKLFGFAGGFSGPS